MLSKKQLFYFFTFCFLVSASAYAQEVTQQTQEVDNKYREDQFYFSVTYNIITNRPQDVSQQGFSSGFHAGFIRDMPFNKKRTLAFGLGLGLSANTYNHNIRVSQTNNTNVFSVIDGNTSFSKNRYFNYLIEMPFEFRWRNSTPESYNFWRIYTGFKLGYMFASKTKYIGEPSNTSLNNISEFNKLQCGLTLSVGYNTWNAYLYYGLNPLFSSGTKLDNGNALDINTMKIGLIFYIL